ncbi:MAG: ParA family protein [Candidatus Nanopelagicales bacterium]|nr:ParA family protein [Candidatus Nanopelagicales bacterium]
MAAYSWEVVPQLGTCLTPACANDVESLNHDVPRETSQSREDLDCSFGVVRSVDSIRRSLGDLAGEQAPRPSETRIIAVANQKGGVGKTTSAVNIAAALGFMGQEVLVVDMDPQGNASSALGVDHGPEIISMYEVLVEGKSLLDVVRPVSGLPGLTAAPATVHMAGAEIELVNEAAREGRLRSALRQYMPEYQERARRLDYIIIDCPPSLGLLTLNAMVAADEVLIPLQCEYYALEGLGQLLGSIELSREHLNPRLRVSAILLTMFDSRTKLAPQVADDVREHFPDQVLATAIPRSVRISEAPSFGQTVLTYDPRSSGAVSYMRAARELAQDRR